VNVFGHNKIVIEIGDPLEKIEKYQFAWESTNMVKKGGLLKPIKLAPLLTEKDFSLKGKTIILDPGHGGDDPGAFSVNKTNEKIFTLQTAQAAAKLLRSAGATVILTRNEDRRSNLQDIIEFANRSGADIFISIHYNSAYNQDVKGIETYYHNPISRTFAEYIHEALVRGLKRKDHGLRKVRFYVVNHATMPSVLIEPAYLSNPEECGLIGSESFREEVASSIVKGVKSYFSNKSGK
jgi:N-acetylmuramoyl-L-alanine amidase